jgi:hypothetical protein
MGGFTKSKERRFPRRATHWRSASSNRSYLCEECQTGPQTPIPGEVAEPTEITPTLRLCRTTAGASIKEADVFAELTVRTSLGSHSNEILGNRSQLSTLNVFR